MTIDPTDPAGNGGAPNAGPGGPVAVPEQPPPSPGGDDAVARSGDGEGGPTGTTTFSEEVVAKIVGTAAREVPGIHGPGDGHDGGPRVNVEVGRLQVAADLDVVVEYGVSVPEVAAAVRARVVAAVGGMTGLEVVEVNLRVVDVHLPQDDLPPAAGARRVV